MLYRRRLALISMVMLAISLAPPAAASGLVPPDRAVRDGPLLGPDEWSGPSFAEVGDWTERVLADGPTQADPFAAVDACVEADMAERGAHGASIAVALDGELVYTRGYGVKHPEQGGEIDAETLFRIGSVTKMMAAAGVMQQVEAGTVDLDAPVTDYAPELELAAPWDPDEITVHHLLTHSSGFPDRTNFDEISSTTTMAQWAAMQDDVHLLAPAGSFWNYSNPNFTLAGLVLERASGVPHRAYLENALWEPAGMTRTTLDPAAVVADGNYTFGGDDGQVFTPDDYDNLWGSPAGFAFSTPTELVRFALLLMDGGGEVLTPASAAAMQAPHVDRHRLPGQAYGYGIAVDQLHGMDFYEHGGNIPGWSAQFMWLPERGFAVALLATSSRSLTNAARCAVLETLDLAPPETPDLTTDPATWGRYAGTYGVRETWGEQETTWIEHTGDGLTAHIEPGGRSFPLVQLFGDTFAADENADGQPDGSTVTFIAAPDHPERAQWFRNRGFVGIRGGEFPRHIELVGDACTTIRWTPHTAMPYPVTATYGLENPTLTLDDLAIAQDDPSDPTSASYKHDLRLDRPTGELVVHLTGQPEDDLDLFLLHDTNGDGAFAYPDELLADSRNPAAREQVSAGVFAALPGGDYQIWVQGWRVEGEDHTFDLEIERVTGTDLFLRNEPPKIVPGQPHTVDLCARTDDLDATAPRRGWAVLGTGGVPTDLAFPITWTPATKPTPTIFLPTLHNNPPAPAQARN